MKTKISLITLITVLTVVSALMGCKSKDPDITPPTGYEQQPSIIAQVVKVGASGEAQVTISPKVDILFVIDDSESMEIYQDRLKTNVHRLVEGLAEAKSLDVRIAVTQIWDEDRYTPGIVPPTCTLPDGSMHVNYITNGAALPLKLPKGQEAQYKAFAGRNFLSPQEPGAKDVLESSIVLGVQHLVENKPGSPHVCESGPEVESVLGPIQHGLMDDYNKNFWRQGSLKVFIVLSDAKEGSNQTADSLDALIRAHLGADVIGHQDKYRVYAAGIIPGTHPTKACPGDPGFGHLNGGPFPESQIARLTKLSNGAIFSICSPDYGSDLAKFSDDIKKATLKNKVYKIQAVNVNPKLPKDKQFKLLLDGKELKRTSPDGYDKYGNPLITAGGDWAYDSEHDQVIVRGDFWNDHPGGNITIQVPTVN